MRARVVGVNRLLTHSGGSCAEGWWCCGTFAHPGSCSMGKLPPTPQHGAQGLARHCCGQPLRCLGFPSLQEQSRLHFHSVYWPGPFAERRAIY